MRHALVLGSASCLPDDVAAAPPFAGVVAAKDAAWWWPGPLDAAVGFHPQEWPRILSLRAQRCYPAPDRVVSFWSPRRSLTSAEWAEWQFPGGSGNGSSGLFAAKVALVDLGFDRVTLCGVPLTVTDHITGPDTPFRNALDWRKAWADLAPEWRARMRSMSGWTRQLLGGPD